MGYFCFGIEMVSNGIEIDSVEFGVGWRGVDEVKMIEWV